MLTHGYWQRMFGGARDVIGQSLVIDGGSYQIIGVLPASFKLLNTKPEVVLPARINRATTLTAGFGPYKGIARMKRGVTIAEANDDIARLIPLFTTLFPLMSGVTQAMWDSVGTAPNVRPLSEDVIGGMSRPLWILMGTVGFVLLMAWTNVANLLLVRAENRRQEFAVRRALGATRGRMTADLLAESLMLGVAGGAVGVLFAQAAIGLLRRIAPVALPRVDDIEISGMVLLFTSVLSIVTALIFGLLPAMRLGTADFAALKEAGRSISDAPGRHRTRSALVVAQVGLAFLLLIVSGLMGRTFLAMRQVDPGFIRPTEVQTFGLSLPRSLMKDSQTVARTYEDVAEHLKHVPGVVGVGLANMIPMDGTTGGGPVWVQDRPAIGTAPMRRAKGIGPGYFASMGITLIAGRPLAWTDIHQPSRVAWISENLAREYWGDPVKAVGKRIGGLPTGPWDEIVGVVGNVHEEGVSRPAPAFVYKPMVSMTPEGNGFVLRDMSYVVRSNRVGTPGFLRELQQAVWSVNASLPLANVKTLADIEADSMAQTSFAMVMLAIAAPVALLLALVGIYGVVSYIAAERTYEIGIRMAVGAQAGDVRALFLRHGLALTVVGIALGIGAAMLLTPIMSSLLYGVRAIDPLTYAAVAIALSAVTLLATYVPARRASRIEPIVALRSGL
jgi:predicted permease